MKLLTLIRGVPGSGKSTLAAAIARGNGASVVFSTDDYFVGEAGEYTFKPAELSAAHTWNQQKVYWAMVSCVDHIIVANTFIKRWEMKPYIKMAEQHGYDVQEVICKGDFGNVHGVPPEKVAEMKQRFEF